ncbi:hypothetical protein C0W42_01505 [Photobacterium kishitanii]|uniref:glycosyltransferase n=1 Tax=Photobacterium kishitanii TaxID=318456 RepID=UPI000D170BC6|nr:glycosyltransferase [Photobacterium kishitanii]PSU92810.1 hypothetical protein C0W42_01505 [Photobacterium kishitanii]
MNIFFMIIKNIINLPKAIFSIYKNSNDIILCVHFFPILLGIICKFIRIKRKYVFIVHTNVFSYGQQLSGIKKKVFFVFLKLLAKGDCIVFLTKDVALRFSYEYRCGNVYQIFNIYNRRKKTINKIIKSKKDILFVGRLSKEKNIFFIIDVYKKHIDVGGSANLHIVGDGPEYQDLKKEIDSLDSKYNIILHGHISDVGPYYSLADIFILTSSYEGFPVSLLEAIDYNLPIISSDCLSGPKEILKFNNNKMEYPLFNNISILLPVPTKNNIDMYVKALSFFIDKNKYDDSCSSLYLDDYNEEEIFAQWDNVFIFLESSL